MPKEPSSSLRWGQGTRQQATGPGRELILSAAERCYGRQGLSATTIEDVAHEAQVARRTVYRYFPSRQAILQAVIERQASAFFDEIADSLPSPLPPFPALVEHCLLYAIEHGPRAAGYDLLLGGSNAHTTSSYYMNSGHVSRQWQEILAAPFADAQARGEIAADIELPALVAFLGRLVMSWVQYPEPIPQVRKQVKVLLRFIQSTV
ncbi:MAG TPA: TetR/AcrR family transcriptional regulator [Pseudomonadales bacterium]|nr:TetR/AcrR family transcriptional regulator [Pseudomonadales bacterium]